MKNLLHKFGIAILTLALVWSCGKDDGPTPTPNRAPVITAQSFNAAETITDTDVIGEIDANDPDDDALTFSITENSSALFELTDAGALSLQAGKSLNFDVAASHNISVKVTDGEEEASATITINVGDKNTAAPVFGQESYQFEASEGIVPTVIIGTVEATDTDVSDDLTYAITANDNDLFEINNAGEISLDAEMALDYETATEHNITVSVTDGTETVEVDVTITVLDVVDADPNDSRAFVTKWQTDADGETIYIGLNPNYNYDFTINWGDGTVEELNLANPSTISHVYESEGQHTVAIAGDFPAIKLAQILIDINGLDPAPKEGYGLMGIKQWGDIQWQSMSNAFYDATTLEVYNATDAPNLSQVTDMSSMFNGASAFNGDLSSWNTKSVTNMNAMFLEATSFNGNIESWNTENVQSMRSMFSSASAFNRDLSGWDTESVTDMYAMFSIAENFEGAALETWDVSKVTNMKYMFTGATAFNGNINEWATGSVTTMSYMFRNANSFNRNLGAWDISSVDSNNEGGMKKMLDNSGMSPKTYTDTLVGWQNQGEDALPSNIIFSAEGIKYCNGYTTAVLTINNLWGKSWTFTNAGEALFNECN